MSRFEVIAFDADDTLWHNERLYVDTQARFRDLLARYHSPEWIAERLYQAEMRNLPHFGYGIKAFALSLDSTQNKRLCFCADSVGAGDGNCVGWSRYRWPSRTNYPRDFGTHLS